MAITLDIQKRFLLSRITTFRIGGPAKFYVEVKNVDELCAALVFAKKEKVRFMIVGGGSNMLVSDAGYDGLVIVLRMRGIVIEKETKHDVWLRIAAGEVWDKTVAKIVSRGLWGVENLSYIPGSTGAAAVQNIGAYGQEVKDVIESVEAYDTKQEAIVTILNKECHFRYRKSIFNDEAKGRFVILSIVFRLKKSGAPVTSYPDVIKYFEEHPKKKPTLTEMRKAITAIRKHKLPDPKNIGNSGSFFKNLYISEAEYKKLFKKASRYFSKEQLEKLEELKNKFFSERGIKIPTAFLIDASGLRGATYGGAKVHENQVLVLINATGKAKAHDVMLLVKKIRKTVYKKTGAKIVLEPELVGFSRKQLKSYLSLL